MTIKTNTSKLLNQVLVYGIDLWLFDQIFMDTGKTYEYYDALWNSNVYVSRIRMDKTQFEITKDLLKRYKK